MTRSATLGLALLSLAACAGQDLIVEDLVLPDVAIDPAEVQLGPGTSVQLHATVPGYPPSEPITWSVADPALASISPAGLLTIDPCAPASTTQARASWTAHPEKQASANVFVIATSAARISIQAITDAATSLPVAIEAASGTVDVHGQFASGDCFRGEKLALIATQGETESVIASVTLNPALPLPRPTLVRWNSTELANGDYSLILELTSGAHRERSSAVPVRITNPD